MMSDLINRQDAIYALTEANLKNHMDSVEGGQENRSAIRIIMELPSADRKRGEWMYLYEDNYKCSICGSWWCCTDSQINEMHYCPNCGSYNNG
mgnify:CR=1 FL=1